MNAPVHLDTLRTMVGAHVGTSQWFAMTQAMIDAHAQTTQDDQFIHTDPTRAAQTPFGTTIAHGFLTLGMLSAMAYDAQPKIDGETISVNYGMNHLRFLAPVPADSRIRGHFTLKALDQSKPNEITTIWTVWVEIETQTKPALVAEWINRHYLGAQAPMRGTP